MDFGRVPENELDKIDFSLLAEPAFNKIVLKGKAAKSPKIYIGTNKWGRTEWLGRIYPPRTKEKEFLDHYVQHYNSIELNATHYKIYGEAGIKKWADKAAGRDFKFCPKMYQGVTHRGSLKGKNFALNEYFRGIVAFKEHLGPIFMQVSETFSPKRKEELFEFLKTMPTDLQFFQEVRHPNWFADKDAKMELFEKLRKMNIGAVITDTAGRRDCTHMHLTIPKAFIRFVATGGHATDYLRIDIWVEKIKNWLENGLQELYFFLHVRDEKFTPELSIYFIEKLNKECGLNLLKPAIIPTLQQNTLFKDN